MLGLDWIGASHTRHTKPEPLQDVMNKDATLAAAAPSRYSTILHCHRVHLHLAGLPCKSQVVGRACCQLLAQANLLPELSAVQKPAGRRGVREPQIRTTPERDCIGSEPAEWFYSNPVLNTEGTAK